MSTLNKQTMIQSYGWTSFSPEKRGEADFNHYDSQLSDDLKTLMDANGSTGNYEAKYCQRVMLIFARQSRCASPMITGPANFNNRRNGKAWDSRDRALSDFDHWRKKYINAATRERTLSPEAEIDKTLEEIERLEIRRDMYKLVNKLKTPEARVEWLKANNLYTLRMHTDLEWGNGSLPSYKVTSLTTKIRERNKKLETMKNRIEVKSDFEDMTFIGGKIFIDNDRVIVHHDEKPSKEIIEAIKRNGFKYSPKTTSWVRKHTENAMYSAKQLLTFIKSKEV